MKTRWKCLLAGAGALLATIVLIIVFKAYQMPALLLDWTNLSYCG